MFSTKLIKKQVVYGVAFFLSGSINAEACMTVPVPIPVPAKATYGSERPRLYTHPFGTTVIIGDSKLFYNHRTRQWCIDSIQGCLSEASKIAVLDKNTKEKIGFFKIDGHKVTVSSIDKGSGKLDESKPYFTVTASLIASKIFQPDDEGKTYTPHYSRLTVENFVDGRLDNILEYTSDRSKFLPDGQFKSMVPHLTKDLGPATDNSSGIGDLPKENRTGKRYSISPGCGASYKIDSINSPNGSDTNSGK